MLCNPACRVGEQWRRTANYRPYGAHRSQRGRYLYSSPLLPRGIVDNALVKSDLELRSCSASLRLLKCESGINRRLPHLSSARDPPIYSVSHLTRLRFALLGGTRTLPSTARRSFLAPTCQTQRRMAYFMAEPKFTGQHGSRSVQLTCSHGFPLAFHKQVD